MLGFGSVSELPISALPSAAAPGAYTLTASAGSFTISGQDAALLRSRLLSASAGTYTETGQAATLTYTPVGTSYTLTASAGSYAETGQAIALKVGHLSSVTSATYSLTGNAATLVYTPTGGGTVVGVASGTFLTFDGTVYGGVRRPARRKNLAFGGLYFTPPETTAKPAAKVAKPQPIATPKAAPVVRGAAIGSLMALGTGVTSGRRVYGWGDLECSFRGQSDATVTRHGAGDYDLNFHGYAMGSVEAGDDEEAISFAMQLLY